MFGYNKFKAEMINELMAAGTTTTVYRVGDFVDLCRGPHIPTYVQLVCVLEDAAVAPIQSSLPSAVSRDRSKSIVAMECTKLGAAYWRGNVCQPSAFVRRACFTYAGS